MPICTAKHHLREMCSAKSTIFASWDELWRTMISWIVFEASHLLDFCCFLELWFIHAMACNCTEFTGPVKIVLNWSLLKCYVTIVEIFKISTWLIFLGSLSLFPSYIDSLKEYNSFRWQQTRELTMEKTYYPWNWRSAFWLA